jgi:hypothetical protein
VRSQVIERAAAAHKVAVHPAPIRARSIASFVALALAGAFLPGCTKGELTRNIYEGARVHNESLKSTPLENPRLESLSHDDYERERNAKSPGQGDPSSPRCGSAEDISGASGCPRP